MKCYTLSILTVLIVVFITASCVRDPVAQENPKTELIDYFPLKVGNKWSYHYNSYERVGYWEKQEWYDYSESWEVKETYNQDTIKVYKLEKIIFGTKILKIDRQDTSYTDTSHVNNIDFFTIEENKEHFLTIIHPKFWRQLAIKRMQSLASNDTLINDFYGVYCEKYVKNIGLINKYYHDGSNMYKFEDEYLLESFDLVQ